MATLITWLLRGVILLPILLASGLSPAAAEGATPLKGIALVIGQSDYDNLPDLANPANDARAMDRLLSDLGFDVNAVPDGDRKRLDRALQRFEEDAADADVALIYYSGHGVEAGGENYLIPVDARMPAADGPADDLLAIDPILERLRREVPIVIVLLDACRSDPFPAGTFVATAGPAAAPVSAVGLGQPRGAAPLRTEGSETLGTVIGFAAEPGKAALDGEPGGNSPYAAALLKHLGAGGYDFGDVMTMVSEEVYLKTATRQLPWTNASLRRLLYFGLDAEKNSGDEHAIRDGRRKLLLTISETPAATRRLVEQVAENNAVPLDALYGMLGVLGVNTSDGDIARHLSEGAERLKSILAQRDMQTRQDPDIVRLAALADSAQSEGAIALALRFRDQASARAEQIDAALDEAEANIAGRRLELAATFRSNADTAILNFDFATAAKRYGDAFAQAERWDIPLAYKLKVLQGDALADQGDYKGDNAALERSVAIYQEALDFGKSGPNARRDAALKGNMAIVMTKLGSRAADTVWLDRATAIYREVSAALPRKRYPEDWAYTQLNLGSLYQTLADRTGDPAYLDKALEAFQGAAKIMTRKAAPYEWAGLQMNIGNVQASRGQDANDPKSLRQAEKSIEAALKVWTREKEPQSWALAQANLGSVLRALGTLEGDAATLQRSIDAQRSAMEIATRERQPVDWAASMNNLGSALLELAAIQKDSGLYAQAIEAYRSARTVNTREDDPNAFATSWYNEGRSLLFLGRHEGNLQRFVEARDAMGTAIDVLSGTGNPIGWARAKSVLGEILFEIGVRAKDEAALKEARAAFDDARTTFARNGMGESGQGFWEKQIAAIDAELAQ